MAEQPNAQIGKADGSPSLDALVQVPTTHYMDGYDTLERFQSYWHQLQQATALGGRVVEIGIGNGTVSAILRLRGLEVVTVDLDSNLRPDVVADIRDLPFETGSFDGALACEVLEHLPWDDLPKALGELRRVARKWTVVSVPSVGPGAGLQAWLPNALHISRMMLRGRWGVRDGLWALTQSVVWRQAGGKVSRFGSIDPVRERKHVFDGEHHWVLGEAVSRPSISGSGSRLRIHRHAGLQTGPARSRITSSSSKPRASGRAERHPTRRPRFRSTREDTGLRAQASVKVLVRLQTLFQRLIHCETPGIPEGSSQKKWLWGGVIAVLIGVAVTKGRDWYIDLLFVAAVGCSSVRLFAANANDRMLPSL